MFDCRGSWAVVVCVRMIQRRWLASACHRRALRADQPGLFSERGPPGPDLARRNLLRDLSARGLAPGMGLRMERPDRGRLWGVLASVAGIVVIGLGNFWGERRARRPAEVRANRARRSLAGRCGRVLGRLYRGEQAAGRAARCHAGRSPRRSWSAACFRSHLRSGPGRAC